MLPMELAIVAFIAGIILLYKGSDVLVDGTTGVAAHLGVSSMIISVIVVAFGTSAPEFAISVGASVQQYAGFVPDGADISIGNIIGSCIANLLLVIGISAVINPIKIQKGVIRRELPIVTMATGVLLLFALMQLFDEFHRVGGILFSFFFILFIWYFIRCAKKERVINEKFNKDETSKNILFVIFGIAGVVLGAWFLIESAISLAYFFKIPTFVISLSLVAVGTSLPELVVSAMASFKNESDIAIGNVLGSNVFNIFLILGISALFIPLNAIGSLDHLILLLLITLLMVPVLRSNHKISRVEGFVLLIIYALYMWYTFGGDKILGF
ncbi:MAG: calcium/sodium antiporter [Candidatus Thermoplasmatota archaeon]|nr:calcium/sodium antiporter [Candidatus Thermoplasmatota archaeon]